jgi:DNA primase
MNTAQAKQIHLRDLLENLDHEPKREDKGEGWYLSPFRQETEPSFKITRDGKAWYDHGAAEGGNILDFIIRYYGLGQSDIAGALQQLRSLKIGSVRPTDRNPAQQTLWQEQKSDAPIPTQGTVALPEEPSGSLLTITKIQPLQNQALQQYLRKRCVYTDTARRYLQEIYYRRQDKSYFALAFANESGGYELRNPYFQGTFGTKDVTLLYPNGEASGSSVAVFEGFMDFLSALTYTKRPAPDGMALVLNSASMRERALKLIRERQIETVYLYLDHDPTGRTLTAWFQEQLQARSVEDKSGFYAGHKDLNAWLMAQKQAIGR